MDLWIPTLCFVQQVYSELQKHTDRCRKTNTHILIGGYFNTQTTKRKQSTPITSEDTHSESKAGQWLRHWAVQHHLILANTFYKKQDYHKATDHSTKQHKQFDSVLMSRALFRHCRDAHVTDRST